MGFVYSARSDGRLHKTLTEQEYTETLDTSLSVEEVRNPKFDIIGSLLS